jgi:hypothetical protein
VAVPRTYAEPIRRRSGIASTGFERERPGCKTAREEKLKLSLSHIALLLRMRRI